MHCLKKKTKTDFLQQDIEFTDTKDDSIKFVIKKGTSETWKIISLKKFNEHDRNKILETVKKKFN